MYSLAPQFAATVARRNGLGINRRQIRTRHAPPHHPTMKKSGAAPQPAPPSFHFAVQTIGPHGGTELPARAEMTQNRAFLGH